MKLVADESVDFSIIRSLRKKEFEVISILEDYSGISDVEVLRIAVKNNCLLITEDKDFGELTYRLKHKHCGVLLIRLNDVPRQNRIILAVETIVNYIEKIENSFAVLNKQGLRIKPTV